MRYSNHFEPHLLLDSAAPGRYLPDQLLLTIFATGSGVDEFARVLNSQLSPEPFGQALATLAAARRPTLTREIPAPTSGIFRIALGHLEALSEIASALNHQVKAAWPDLTLVVVGWPTRAARVHQVLVIDAAQTSFAATAADSLDTPVVIGSRCSVWGLLSADGWRDTTDDMTLEALGGFFEDYLDAFGRHSVPRSVVFVCLGEDPELNDDLAQACPSLTEAGLCVWTATS